MPVGKISRSIAQTERGKQAVPSFDVGRVGASVGGNTFNALDYPSCYGWWDTNQFCNNPGDVISHFPDLSGALCPYVQSNSVRRPIFRLVNGRPALEFDGVNHTMSQDKGPAVPIANIATVFIVAQNLQLTDDDSEHWMMAAWASVNSIALTSCVVLAHPNWQSSNQLFQAGSNGATDIQSTLSSSDGNRHVFTVVNQGANSRFHIDGVPFAGTMTTQTNQPFVKLVLGHRGSNDRLFKGYFHEGVYYPIAHTLPVIKEIEQRLGKKWGVQITP